MFTQKGNRLLMPLLMMLMVVYTVLPYTAEAEGSVGLQEHTEVEKNKKREN